LVPLDARVHRASRVRRGARAKYQAPQPQAVLQKAVCSPDLWLQAEPVHFQAARTALRDELVSEPVVRRASWRLAHL